MVESGIAVAARKGKCCFRRYPLAGDLSPMLEASLNSCEAPVNLQRQILDSRA